MELLLYDTTLEAAEDLSAVQFYAVGLDSNGKACIADGDEVISFGILQNKPKITEAAGIRRAGKSKAIVAGSITIGDQLKPDGSTGRLTTASANDRYIAIALQGATTIDETISVEMEFGKAV